ncbi:hypothetical protein HMN09_00888700 [Mycena chlorophos]|uniref:Uncharacterized protein n=1 Tax=Mycena chlorophos TaxID=658473 RepID=A0A8H6SP16_MYCCL|nr:hypothetical protein HMN09_00888700 [Mycena chlorophos]
MPFREPEWMEPVDPGFYSRSPTPPPSRPETQLTPPPDSKERKRQRSDDPEEQSDGAEHNRRKVSAGSKGSPNPWREPYPKTITPLGASGHDLLLWTNGATSRSGRWQFQIVKHGETDPVIPAQHNIDVAYFVESLGRWISCGTVCLTGGHIANPSEKVKVTFRDGLEVICRLPGRLEDDVIQIPRPPPMSVSTF